MEVTFNIPAGMTAEQVAKKLNRIIRRIRHDLPEVNDGSYGPWEKGGNSWQLDGTNDYFFHYHGATGMMRCRDNEQEHFTRDVVECFEEDVAIYRKVPREIIVTTFAGVMAINPDHYAAILKEMATTYGVTVKELTPHVREVLETVPSPFEV